MGLLFKEYVNSNCLLGLWETEEDFFTLYSGLNLSKEEIDTLNSFRNYDRKLEWLTVRRLLYEMTGPDVKIFYNGKRKPFLNDRKYNISISHSHKLTSILLSKQCRVGVDLEYISNEIGPLANKFLNQKEKQEARLSGEDYHIYLYWCAKEAIFKICDKQDISLRKHIYIDPFEPGDEGKLTGRVCKNQNNEEFCLEYFRYGNYFIVWCCK